MKCSQKAGAKDAWPQYFVFSPYLSLVKHLYFALRQVHSFLVCCVCLDIVALTMPTSVHPEHFTLKVAY